jgi:hypothetical protein
MNMNKKDDKKQPTPYHIPVTNKNRTWLEKRYGFEIPKDVDFILADKNLDLYLEESIENAIKLNGKTERHYDGIEEID